MCPRYNASSIDKQNTVTAFPQDCASERRSALIAVITCSVGQSRTLSGDGSTPSRRVRPDALAPTLDDIDRRVSHAVQNRTGTAELLSPRGRLPSRVRLKVLVTRSAEYRELGLEANADHSLTPIDRYARSPVSESTVLLLSIRGSATTTRRMTSPVTRSS